MNGCGTRLLTLALLVGLLCAAAFSPSRADDKPTRVPTTHYVDSVRHVELDVPLSWERRFSEDESTRFIFVTNGKAAADAQPPEFTIATAGPGGDDLKSPASYAAARKKAAGAGMTFDAEQDANVDGEKAVRFTGSGKTKAGAAKALYVVTIHNGVGYSVSFACDPATFDAELKGAQPVIDSIKWSK